MNFMRCLQAGCMWCWALVLSKHCTPAWKIQDKADKIPDGWMAVPGDKQTRALLLVWCRRPAGFNQPQGHLCPNISLQHSTIPQLWRDFTVQPHWLTTLSGFGIISNGREPQWFLQAPHAATVWWAGPAGLCTSASLCHGRGSQIALSLLPQCFGLH